MQAQPLQPNLTEDDIKAMPHVEQMICRMHKSEHVQEYLLAIRSLIIEDRANQKLNWSPDKIYEAAAASGFSHGQLILITQLCNLGHVIQE